MKKTEIPSKCRETNKILLIMKLSTIMLVVFSLNINAVGFGQFSFGSEGKTTRDILNIIEKESNYRFFYNDDFINDTKFPDLQINDGNINEVLDKLLASTDYTYKLYDNNLIVISLKNDAGRLSDVQQKTVRGNVTDRQGNPLPGVTISIKGTTRGTATDLNGNYILDGIDAQSVLVASFIGFTAQEIVVGDRSQINISLEEGLFNLDEVVVVGYGVQKKSVVTGAISGTNAKEIQNQPIYRVDQALQGRVSGVTFAATSGQPGTSATVRVRGTTSINNSDPLYVVDGIPLTGNIDYLNQNDIESIEVLKDAASAAIYGARAAAGVILVTTKKGSLGAARISYNGYYGLQGPARKLDMLNATEYATLYNEMLENSGKESLFENPEALGEGTDWLDAIFSYNSVIQNHDINISGGTDKLNYYTSFGYFGMEGIVTPDVSYYKRYNFRLNMDYKLKDWLTFGEKLSYSLSQRTAIEDNNNASGVLMNALHIDPITPVIETDPAKLSNPPYTTGPCLQDENGNYYAFPYYAISRTNPLILAYYNTNIPNTHNVTGNFYVELNPIKNLTLRSSVGIGGIFSIGEAYASAVYFNPSQYYLTDAYTVSYLSNYFWNLENTASYNLRLDKHNFVFLAGTGNYVDNMSQYVALQYQNLPVDNFEDASLNWPVVDSDKKASGAEGNIHKVNSLYGRLIYDYDEKYLFTGIIRRDGSSRFGTNNKFGIFPSVSAGWVLSREAFWNQNKIVNFLKIRASYGETGNDNIGDFKYVSIMQGNRNYTIGNQLFIGYSPEAIANPDLRWESTTQLNIGFDATFLEDLRLTFDWFDKRTNDMLMTVQVPSYSGAGNPTGNVASMKNTGIEAELGYRKTIGKFTIDLNGSASYIKNEVTDIGENEFIKGGLNVYQTSYEITRISVGLPFNYFYGFEHDGIFQNENEVTSYVNKDGAMILPDASPGDFKWKDLNGDGTITGDDRKYLGNSLPDWTYGLNISASWKNFDLSMFGQGVHGNLIFDHIRYGDSHEDNWTSRIMDRWHGEGTTNTVPILKEVDSNENFLKPSQYQLFSGSYFRLKNAQIGYSLPEALLSKIRIEKLRFYLSASNLFTITKYPGFDPEIGSQRTIYGGDVAMGVDRGVYPQARGYMIGLNVTF
jgi:TonB-dependent starch-binding outer membrane protein SusC